VALKIFTFLLLLFSGVITYLSLDESMFKQPKPLSDNFPTIDLSTIQSYKITQKGVEAKITADRVSRYNNKDEMYNIKAYFKESNSTQNISANFAILKEPMLYLKDEIVYNNQNMLLLSDNLEYNMSNHVAISNSNFTLKSINKVAKGSSFRYDSKNGIFDANDIEFRIKE